MVSYKQLYYKEYAFQHFQIVSRQNQDNFSMPCIEQVCETMSAAIHRLPIVPWNNNFGLRDPMHFDLVCNPLAML